MKKIFGASFSKIWVRAHIFFAVLIQRTIGRVLAGGKKTPNIKQKILPRYFARKYLWVVSPPLGGSAPKGGEGGLESNGAPPTARRAEPPQRGGAQTSRNLSAKGSAKTETIWQFWDNPAGQKTPDIVTACMKSAEKHRGDFRLKVLNLETIGKYSDLPGFVHDRLKDGRMRFAHFSDLLRLNLLKNHGGVWMDPTCLMFAEIPKYITEQEFFVFLTDRMTHFPYSFMQNFFIRAQKGAFLADIWYRMCIEYWKNESTEIEYFQHQLMFKALVENNETARALFEKMPHVSEDEMMQFIGDRHFTKLLEQFDPAEWDRIQKESFIQKTTYRINKTIVRAADYPNSYYAKIADGTAAAAGAAARKARAGSNEKILISVIIPIYNAEKYLKETLDCLTHQTHRNLEIICVLDCPPDNSEQVARECAAADTRIRIIAQPKNMDAPATRNKGVAAATGEFIHFMDADDLINPDFYEVMLAAAVSKNCDVAACSVYYEKKPYRSIWFRKEEVVQGRRAIRTTRVSTHGWAWRYLIRREFWNRNNFSFPDLVPMEDKPVMIPMIYHANAVAIVPGAQYLYKYRPSSILNTASKDKIRRRSANRKEARRRVRAFKRSIGVWW